MEEEIKVRCIQTYNDSELKTKITNNAEDKNYERVVSRERANVLVSAGVCEILEQPNADETENTGLDTNKIEGTENTELNTNEVEEKKKNIESKSKTSKNKTK